MDLDEWPSVEELIERGPSFTYKPHKTSDVMATSVLVPATEAGKRKL
jgi:hypothetical protein